MTAFLVATTDRPYQLLPPLDADQRHLLKQSIEKNGVLEPVVFDEDGEILDGHHRVEIAEELGIEYPRRVISDLDGPGKFAYALTVNVARRHLDQSARGALVAQLRMRGMSVRAIAEKLGVSRGTVSNDLAQLSNSGQLNQPERITGADGKNRPATRPTPKTPGPVEADAAPSADPGATPAPSSLVPQPIAAHYETDAWNGDGHGSCGVDCACGATFDGFDTIAEAVEELDRHIETPEPVESTSTAPAGSGTTSPAPEPPKPTLRIVPTEDEKRAAVRRDARGLLRRAVEILAPAHNRTDFAETWARQLGPYDDELSELMRRAREAMATLDDLIEGAGQ